MRFLHCSDVHVTQNYRHATLGELGWRRCIALLELTVGGRARAYQSARATLGAIAADATRLGVDHLIVSGDLTAYGMESEFQGARQALGAWADDPRRCTVVPGNHDTYSPDTLREERFERHFGHLLGSDLPEYAVVGGYPFVRLLGTGVAVVGLRSVRIPPFPGLAFGRVGKAQLLALAELLADPRVNDRQVLIAVHHAPLAPDGGPDRLNHGLWDAQELFRVVHGPRRALLHGHIHRRYHHLPTEQRPHLFGAGSSTLQGREGYWLIDVDDAGIEGTMRRPGAD